MQLADEFIENVVTASCRLAKHRKSTTLELKDVQLHLGNDLMMGVWFLRYSIHSVERNWNMWIPGFSSDDRTKPTTLPSTEAHKQRINLIKKSKK